MFLLLLLMVNKEFILVWFKKLYLRFWNFWLVMLFFRLFFFGMLFISVFRGFFFWRVKLIDLWEYGKNNKYKVD